MRPSTAEFAPVIAELARNAAAHFGADPVEIEPVRRIDGPYSSVLNVRVSGGNSRSGAYIKVYKPRSNSEADLARADRFLQREFRATSTLHAALAAQPEIGVLRPIACLPEHRAIVTAEVIGRPFGALLNEASASDARILEIGRRVGRWVHAYQEFAPADGRVELSERRAYIDERLHQLERRVIDSAARRQVLATVDALSSAIGSASVPAVAIHADLTPTNVLVGDDGRVTVLDFTMAKAGSAYHDLAHMYFHLGLFGQRGRGRAALARGVQRAVLEGYDALLSAEDPLFALMVWQHAVCHLAMLDERRLPLGGAAYRWLLRRRWRDVSYLASSITRTAE
jgi:aminoglycoside phosphotransferase (APT) family kinase protein